MDWESILKIVAVVAGLAGTAVGVAKYFAGQQKMLTSLRDEIKDLKTQTKVLKQPLLETVSPPATGLYQRLLAASTEAEKAVAADMHSISAPIPSETLTHLRIILSTDPQSEKVLGREFPITRGIAGWVFQRQQPSFKNLAETDPRYFSLVDKAAGTHTGAGAILTLPLMAGKSCCGVIQFMKIKGGRFEESDVQVASRLTPAIARLLGELQDSSTADVPVVAYGDAKLATVLFADITQFSRVTRSIRLLDSVAMLNEYYNRLLEFALKKGGRLEEYLGDGFYISFTNAVAAEAARAAVSSATEMQAEYQKLLRSWKDYQHPVSDSNTHRIGIATGEVYTGNVGHPQDRRHKLIGTAVDLASHLCEDLKTIGGGIAVCPRTKGFIEENEFPSLRKHGFNHGEAWVPRSPPPQDATSS
jgi:class 3 adenylate cyclase